MNKFATFITSVCGAFCLNFPGNFPTLQQPNVILIMADDLNTKVGFLNERVKAQTPYLDALAKQSVNFTDAHAPATVCNPSRLSILTSKLPSNTGVYSLFPAEVAQQAIEQSKLTTLMDSFHNSGYETFGTGKIFHWGNDSAKFFDKFYLTSATEDSSDNRAAPNWKYWDKEEKDLSDSKKTKWAIDLLRAKHSKPFFIMIGYQSPHLPWIVPKKYFDLYSRDKIAQTINDPCKDLLDIDGRITIKYRGFIYRLIGMLDDNSLPDAIKAYLASVSYLDHQVGLLLAELNKSKFANNTIVIFTSDQGYHLGEKCTVQKQTLWRESSQIPFLIRIPQSGGKVCKKTVSLIDLYPTLAELCNLKTGSSFDGHSLVTLLKNPQAQENRPVISSSNFRQHSIRTNEWCYINYNDGLEELYDRRKDPYERDNLANNLEFTKVKDQLRKLLPIINTAPLTINSKDE